MTCEVIVSSCAKWDARMFKGVLGGEATYIGNWDGGILIADILEHVLDQDTAKGNITIWFKVSLYFNGRAHERNSPTVMTAPSLEVMETVTFSAVILMVVMSFVLVCEVVESIDGIFCVGCWVLVVS